MKNLKFSSLLVGCLAVLGVAFTSCDTDNDDWGLTPEQVQQAYNAVRGEYSGRLIYPTTRDMTLRDRTDTTSISWSILTDSTMTIHDFPPAVLATFVSNEKVAEALRAEAPQDIQCSIGFIDLSPVAFLINPATPTFNFTIDGKAYKVQIPFHVNTSVSYGVLTGGKLLQMQIVEGAVYNNGQLTNWLSQGVGFVLEAEK